LRDIIVDERKILKAKVVPVQAMKACRRSGSLAPLLLNLDITWR
jgi:hypothetical protein